MSDAKSDENNVTFPIQSAEEWPDRPLLLQVNPKCENYLSTSHTNNGFAIHANEVFDFESRSFAGKGIIRCPDMPNTQQWYFKNRKRKMDISIQGQFKRRICLNRVFTGQCFDAPFRSFPGQMIVSGALKVIKTLSPGLRVDIDGPRPHLISHLAQASQVINVSRIGEETPLPNEPTEDMGLLHQKFVGLNIADRKSLLSNAEELDDLYFEPGLVYTFSFYSHMISPLSYHFFIMGWKFGVQKYLPSPFQLMALIEPDESDLELFSTDDTPSSDDSDNNSSNNHSHASNNSTSYDNNHHNNNNNNTRESSSSRPSLSNDKLKPHPLDNSDYLWNFICWHEKLVDELKGVSNDTEPPAAETSEDNTGYMGSVFGRFF